MPQSRRPNNAVCAWLLAIRLRVKEMKIAELCSAPGGPTPWTFVKERDRRCVDIGRGPDASPRPRRNRVAVTKTADAKAASVLPGSTG